MMKATAKRRSEKRKPRFEGSLPHGSTTTDPKLYAQAWRGLAQPIAEEFGWGIIGFEPGIMFSIPAHDAAEPPCALHGHNIVLSVNVATKLCKLIENARSCTMKTQELFNLLQDAQDVLIFFKDVTTTKQMIARLKRINRQAPGTCAIDLAKSLRVLLSTIDKACPGKRRRS
jgi:hypothetical protein